jgi:hypothetical protein
MNISPTNHSSQGDPAYSLSPTHPLQDLKTLQAALKSGNFTDAQQALTAFQNALAGSPQMEMNGAVAQDSQIADDVAALQNALSSNDVTTAHQAFATLRHDLRAMRQAQFESRHGGVGTMPPVASGDPVAVSNQDSGGNLLDVQA